MSSARFLVTLVAACSLPASAQAAAPVTGRWVTQAQDSIVEIYNCGGAVCGKISKFLVQPPNGVGQKDINNPDKTLRNRTLLGMNVLTGFREAGNEWKGKAYDPKSGRTYRSIVYKGKSGNLVVKGCVGPICRSQSWAPER